MSRRRLLESELNHIRRLVGWVRCEIDQSPEEQVALAKELAPKIGPMSPDGIARLAASAEKAARVPKYVRAAIKALEKTLQEMSGGEIIEAERTFGPLARTTKGADK